MYKPLLIALKASLLLCLSQCAYAQNVTGDFFICSGSSITYSIDSPATSATPWSITPVTAGTMTQQSASQVNIRWGNSTNQVIKLIYEGGTFRREYPIVIERSESLACNKAVKVSLDADCDMRITPDIILEDMQYDISSYQVTLKDTDGSIIPAERIQGKHIGRDIEVIISQLCSGNNCWGYIKAEDKNIPVLRHSRYELQCHEDYSPHAMQAFPIEGHMELTGDHNYSVSAFHHCEDMRLRYQDSMSVSDCHGGYGNVMYRQWTLTTAADQQVKSMDTIYIHKADIHAMSYPGDMDDELALDCQEAGQEDGWPMLASGMPDPDYTGRPQGLLCGNIEVKYQDLKFDGCGDAAYKLKRTWQVVDWCTGEVAEQDQYIHVYDRTPPQVSALVHQEVISDALDCDANFTLAYPEVEDCSDYELTVAYQEMNDTALDSDDYKTQGVTIDQINHQIAFKDVELQSDSIAIRYTVTDDCGNSSEAFSKISIKDKRAPIAICDDETTIGLSEHGQSWADYRAIDDGSWDNCSITSRLLRKVDGYACDSIRKWSEQIKFCCEDIGQIIKVELKVTDQHGNANICWTKVKIQDNEAPKVISCPKDTLIDCGDYITDFRPYGQAVFSDFCALMTEDTVSYHLNECGVGEIIRTFRAYDDRANESSCTQVIYVGSKEAFGTEAYHITWPEDLVIDDCTAEGYESDDLEDRYSKPRFSDLPCSEPKANYTDTKFYNEEDNICIKILRDWTVIDWCRFDPQTTFNGVFNHTQVIEIKDSSKPEFTSGCDDVAIADLIFESACSFRVPELMASAVDNSCVNDDLRWKHHIDFDADGEVDLSGSGDKIVDQVFGVGDHTITWEVEDDCGNQSRCSQQLKIQDQKTPSPVCVSSLVVVLDSEDQAAKVWANDFDLKSEDNCTAASELTISFSDTELIPAMSVDCTDLDGKTETLIELFIYVTDEAGNQDFCQTYMRLQNNGIDCDSTVAIGSAGQISGHIHSPQDMMIPDVEVRLSSATEEKRSMTSTEGSYAFSDLAMYDNYQLDCVKEGDHVAGVSTLDLVLIQQHILGVKTFDSPYQIIAADANYSNGVSATDLVTLRSLLVAKTDQLPGGRAWVFVDESVGISDTTDPFPVSESIMIMDMVDAEVERDIIAIKTGDVNGSYQAGLHHPEKREINVQNIKYRKVGKEIEFYIPEKIEIIGLQAELSFEGSHMDLKVSSELFPADIQFSTSLNDSRTIIKISMSDAFSRRMQKGDKLFTVSGYDRTEPPVISHSPFSSEMYMADHNDQIEVVALLLDQNAESDDELTVHQNQPNPFVSTTTIGFYLPAQSEMTLSIYGVDGELISQESHIYPSGHSQWIISEEDLASDGIYYYNISNEEHSITKKMFLIR